MNKDFYEHLKKLQEKYKTSLSDTYMISSKVWKQNHKGSKGEQITRSILKKYKFRFEEQKTFKNLVNPKTDSKLRFDFYLPAYKCLIEIQGGQHYKPTDFSGHMSEKELQESFEDGQMRDSLKVEYCKKHKYKLYCVDWNGNETKLIKELTKVLRELKRLSEEDSESPNIE